MKLNYPLFFILNFLKAIVKEENIKIEILEQEEFISITDK